jgi:hypothetical protein
LRSEGDQAQRSDAARRDPRGAAGFPQCFSIDKKSYRKHRREVVSVDGISAITVKGANLRRQHLLAHALSGEGSSRANAEKPATLGHRSRVRANSAVPGRAQCDFFYGQIIPFAGGWTV